MTTPRAWLERFFQLWRGLPRLRRVCGVASGVIGLY
jgi:hypothetical protein